MKRKERKKKKTTKRKRNKMKKKMNTKRKKKNNEKRKKKMKWKKKKPKKNPKKIKMRKMRPILGTRLLIRKIDKNTFKTEGLLRQKIPDSILETPLIRMQKSNVHKSWKLLMCYKGGCTKTYLWHCDGMKSLDIDLIC